MHAHAARSPQHCTCDCNDQCMVLAVSAQEHFLTLLDLQVTSSQGQYVSSSLDTLLSWKHIGAVTDIKVCADSMRGYCKAEEGWASKWLGCGVFQRCTRWLQEKFAVKVCSCLYIRKPK